MTESRAAAPTLQHSTGVV